MRNQAIRSQSIDSGHRCSLVGVNCILSVEVLKRASRKSAIMSSKRTSKEFAGGKGISQQLSVLVNAGASSVDRRGLARTTRRRSRPTNPTVPGLGFGKLTGTVSSHFMRRIELVVKESKASYASLPVARSTLTESNDFLPTPGTPAGPSTKWKSICKCWASTTMSK